MNRLFYMMMSALLLLLPLTATASDNQWGGSGPFATGLANRVITALAVSADGKTVYAGSGSGTVFHYAYTPPTVTSGAASGLGASGATLNGTVNANNADATVSFEYGLTIAYGATVAATPATATGTSGTAVSAALSGLSAGTLYHYRLIAINSGGTGAGTDQTFTTLLAPAFTSGSATSFTYNSAGSFSITASGIPAPTFTTSSTLPGGVTLNSNGALSGTPTVSGAFPLTITATNSAGSTVQSFTLTINKATPAIITWPVATAITYDQTLASSTLSGGSATPTGGAFAWTTPSSAPNAGTASQEITYTPADTANYSTVTGSASVTVNKATPAINTVPAATTITYGQTLASSTLSGGVATTDGAFTWTTPSTAPGAGTASQEIIFTPADTGNYNTALTGQTVTVNKAPLTVTADNKSRAYGAADPPFTATYSGFVYGEDATKITGSPTFTTSAGSSSPEGSYSITPVVTGLSAANYSFSAAPGTLAVGIASQSIIFNPLADKTYGDATFTLAAIGGASGNSLTYSSSDLNVATVSGATVTIVGAGTTTITADQAGTNGAYATATAQQTLTVNKAAITVTADNQGRAYNADNPVLTVTYAGFVSGERPVAQTTIN